MESTGILANYDFTGKTVVVTGGGGVLCGELARAVAACRANVVLLDRDLALAEKALGTLPGTGHRAVRADVLDRAALAAAADVVGKDFGKVDGLINGAGGNHPEATTNAERSFFDLPADALQFVANLNLLGTILPSQAFGRAMARQGEGVILNISSMNAFRPLTRIPAYSAAKAAVSNFTQWLAVHLAQEYSPHIRVNALAPGFFLTEQNRCSPRRKPASSPRAGNPSWHTRRWRASARPRIWWAPCCGCCRQPRASSRASWCQSTAVFLRTAACDFDRTGMDKHKGNVMAKQQFGIVGLGVMGQNLALNLASRGFSVAGFDLEQKQAEIFAAKTAGKKITTCRTQVEFLDQLEQPRRMLIMVPAGPPVDAVIATLRPRLNRGDLLIDGGNTWFRDTVRRIGELGELEEKT